MTRDLVLPIVLSAALHGAVLFGFNQPPRVVPAKPEPPIRVCEFPLLPPPEEPEPVAEIAEARTKASVPDRPTAMVSPEPPAVKVESAFVIKPPVVEIVSDADLRRIVELPAVRGGDGSDPFGPGTQFVLALDNIPRARLQTAPLYPPEARREGLRGEVMVEFIVDESGTVIDARVVHSSSRVFEEPAMRAILKWKFEPGKRRGRIVPFRMAVPVVFNLND